MSESKPVGSLNVDIQKETEELKQELENLRTRYKEVEANRHRRRLLVPGALLSIGGQCDEATGRYALSNIEIDVRDDGKLVATATDGKSMVSVPFDKKEQDARFPVADKHILVPKKDDDNVCYLGVKQLFKLVCTLEALDFGDDHSVMAIRVPRDDQSAIAITVVGESSGKVQAECVIMPVTAGDKVREAVGG